MTSIQIARRRLGDIYRLASGRVIALVAISVPVGVILGIVEIVTASVLYSVLVEFKLVSADHGATRLPLGLNPVLVLLLLSIIAAALRFSAQWLPSMANHSFIARFREGLVQSVLGGVVERSVLSVAEISHLLSNVVQKSGDFIFSFATTATGFCLMLLILSGLLFMSWQMTVIALVFVAFLGLLLVLLRRVYSRYIEQVHVYSRRFGVTFLRDARNNHLLRIFGANEREISRLFGFSRAYFHNFKRYYTWYSFSNSIPALAGVFLIVGMFGLNARMQFLPPEGLLPLVYLVLRMAGGLGSLAMAIGQMHQTRPYFDELFQYLPEVFPEEHPAPMGGEMPAGLFPLVVTDLRFGRNAALASPVSLSARSGDVILISGQSGRGKTTFVMTLVGFLEPLGGRVDWGGMAIERIDRTQLRRRIGYAGPEPYMIDADIRTNLLFGLDSIKVSDAEIEEALRLARADFVFDLEGGLSYRLQEAGEGVSAGQKQRLALARCILRRPEVLLLDEATANIDEETEGQVIENLRRKFPTLLIIAVSHRASLRRFATVTVEI